MTTSCILRPSAAACPFNARRRAMGTVRIIIAVCASSAACIVAAHSWGHDIIAPWQSIMYSPAVVLHTLPLAPFRLSSGWVCVPMLVHFFVMIFISFAYCAEVPPCLAASRRGFIKGLIVPFLLLFHLCVLIRRYAFLAIQAPRFLGNWHLFGGPAPIRG